MQDEPENQGAWPFISLELVKYLEGRTVRVVSRPASASPATGSSKVSAAQQTALIEAALALYGRYAGGLDAHAVQLGEDRGAQLVGRLLLACLLHLLGEVSPTVCSFVQSSQFSRCSVTSRKS